MVPTNRSERAINAVAAVATQTSAEIPNPSCKGLVLFLDITVGAALQLKPRIEVKDPISGNWIVLWTATANLTGVGTSMFSIYPGASFATSGFIEAIQTIIPTNFRLSVVHGNATASTYTLGYALMA